MENILLVIHTLVAVALVGVVLLQRSEGGALGIGGGGGGAGGGMFSSRTAANLLTRATGILAVIFFLSSIGLTVIHTNDRNAGSIVDRITPVAPLNTEADGVAEPDLGVAPPTAGPADEEPAVPRPE
ncbi:preprotein translocase subunit SecG [Pyruvatibacter sp. HU-CL02332]|uniref:preprotein translocase subunit SecG n=1 Tax=Pyruvatibacter sp. HU-CL02332 TaxID=3127650 RepID=UPI0029692F45|nr:preprotein translocase subunit SecG [Alphaproteobacteria bacterium]